MGTFKAIRIDKAEKGTTAALTQFDEAELMEGDVTIRVEYSALNYKDGLAVTGKAPVVRRFPMIAGIDFAGTVEQSAHPAWKAGDKVICNGWGMGETHLGAYAEKARVKGDWLVRLPENISTRDAMAIGTAGYTAMLSVLALEKHGLTPANGRIDAACSAIHGEYSNIFESAATKSSLLHAFRSESAFCGISALTIRYRTRRRRDAKG